MPIRYADGRTSQQGIVGRVGKSTLHFGKGILAGGCLIVVGNVDLFDSGIKDFSLGEVFGGRTREQACYGQKHQQISSCSTCNRLPQLPRISCSSCNRPSGFPRGCRNAATGCRNSRKAVATSATGRQGFRKAITTMKQANGTSASLSKDTASCLL